MDSCKVDKDYDKLANLINRDKLHSLMNPSTREKLREYSIGAEQQSYYDVAVVADENETDKPVFQSFVKNGTYKHGDTNSSDITDKKNAILDCWRCKQKHIPGAKCTFNPPRVDGTNNSRWGAANTNHGGTPFAPKGDINSRLESMVSNSNFPFFCANHGNNKSHTTQQCKTHVDRNFDWNVDRNVYRIQAFTDDAPEVDCLGFGINLLDKTNGDSKNVSLTGLRY